MVESFTFMLIVFWPIITTTYSKSLPVTMAAQEIINMVQKKKRMKNEPFMLKMHGRLIFMTCMVICTLLYLKERSHGLIACSPKNSEHDIQELNNFCLNRVYSMKKPIEFNQKTPYAKTLDFRWVSIHCLLSTSVYFRVDNNHVGLIFRYYQWVLCMVLLTAVFHMLPTLFWHIISSNYLKQLSEELNKIVSTDKFILTPKRLKICVLKFIGIM